MSKDSSNKSVRGLTPALAGSAVNDILVGREDYAPTRNPRLNEMLGLIVLVGTGLLLLALVSYTPTDPSFNTVAAGTTVAAGAEGSVQVVHNWMGVFGADLADVLLQAVGIAVFLVPLMLGQLGVAWLQSRPFGSFVSKAAGLGLWLVFAPAAIALLPGHLLWRHAIPISGVEGRLLADSLLALINLPGTVSLCALMVVLSLYMATSFTLRGTRGWMSSRSRRGGLLARLRQWKQRRGEDIEDEEVPAFQRAELVVDEVRESTTLLAGLFGWFGRRQAPVVAEEVLSEPVVAVTSTQWESLPRPVREPVAKSASLPFEDGWLDSPKRVIPEPLFKTAQEVAVLPEREPEEVSLLDASQQTSSHVSPLQRASAPSVEMTASGEATSILGRGVERGETGTREERQGRPASMERAMPAMPSPMANMRDQNIAFGERADANLMPVAIVPKSIRGYKLPPSSLLYKSDEHTIVREAELREEARVLVEKFAEFGVAGKVEQINPGPVVTTFEFRPDAGVKYSRVTGLADDLCLAMAAESILIERMPGKSTVGIQVPNRQRETIWLRDVVESEKFAQSKSRLPVALGKDISGNIVTGDLAAMPHVLIAGSTGSGKSVAINAMIMSVLFKSTPEQVRMILVDPKRVELGMYEGIPHLFTPIITEAKLAANALRNAVREMERRLKLLAANRVRDIDQFNKLFEHGSEYLFEEPNQEPLPYIMIIIDELADLMILDRSNVEEAITRLAQMARAVGIHLVLATQRPSVDVITGLIKANVPTRMSFRLATKVDSRTIIDSNGAENLLGRGDMMFLPPGTSRLQRVHAPFVTEKETAAVVDFWKAQGTAEYAEGFLDGPKDEKDSEGGGANEAEDNDPLFDDAVRLIFEFGKASTSLLQRRLRVGYGRAAHLIDLMERDGLVGPADGSKPREILKPASFYAEVDAALR